MWGTEFSLERKWQFLLQIHENLRSNNVLSPFNVLAVVECVTSYSHTIREYKKTIISTHFLEVQLMFSYVKMNER